MKREIHEMKHKLKCGYCKSKSCQDCKYFYHQVSFCIYQRMTSTFPNDLIIKSRFIKQFIHKFVKLSRQFSKQNESAAKICICYHGTRSINHKSIIRSNFKVPDGWKVKHRYDRGCYGRGIYMSPDYRLAKQYSDGYWILCNKPKVFVCLSLPGRQFAATHEKNRFKPCKHGYHSHVSPNKKEWIFFDSSHLLPCCLVDIHNIQRSNALAQIIIDVVKTL